MRASADHSSVSRPPTAPTTATTTSTKNSPPSARSVENVCRIGPGSASPLVSITIRANRGTAPRSRSATRRRSASCRSERVLQHRQPLPSSVISSALSRTSASSMPTAPYSLMMTAVSRPSGVARKRRTSVVLPAPRKPVTMVTGMRAPRARFCRRPNGPASREGKRSSIGSDRRRRVGKARACRALVLVGQISRARRLCLAGTSSRQCDVAHTTGHDVRLRTPSPKYRARRCGGRPCRRSRARRRTRR